MRTEHPHEAPRPQAATAAEPGMSLRALAFAALAALTAFALVAPRAFAQTPTATATATATGTATPTATQTIELAPIDGLEVRQSTAQAGQYEAVVTSGLPSGCASFDSITTARNGARIDIIVNNKMNIPAGGACTTIYGTTSHTVTLGSDFVAGTTYTVVANVSGPRSQTRAFVAGTTATPTATGTATATATATGTGTVVPRPANTGNAGLLDQPDRGSRLLAGAVALALGLAAATVVARLPLRRR